MEPNNRPKLRWVKWWYGDWRKDATLRMCSLAARGLWMEMLGIMHEAEPYGHLLVNGKKPTIRQLAGLVSASETEVLSLVEELREAGVYSVTPEGVPFSRRMIRDLKASEIARNYGLEGGNPALVKGEKGGVNPTHKAGLKLEKEREGESREKKESPPTPASGGGVIVRGLFGNAEQGPVTKLPRRARDLALPEHADALAGFEEFWRNYPKERRVKKPLALRAWNAALKRVEGNARLIIDGLRARLHTEVFVPKNGPSYIPHPSTWLNNDGWNDPVPGMDDDEPAKGAG